MTALCHHPGSLEQADRELPSRLPPPRRGLPPGNEGWVPHCPDFLWRLVALIHSMRLSLMKGAHADLSSTAWQKSGLSPVLA